MATFDNSDMVPHETLAESDYASSLEFAAPGITALVDDAQGPNESWMTALARLLPAVAATYQQKQILDIQMQRASQGLPPLNASQYAAGFQVGLSDDTKNLLIMGALGLGAVLLLLPKRR